MTILLIISLLVLVYWSIKYISSPMRKLKVAHKNHTFYFVDDSTNARKNFFITYKGVLFEGEKYIDTLNDSISVISIFIWPHNPDCLNDLNHQDFLFIETKIRELYPSTLIDWKSQQTKNV